MPPATTDRIKKGWEIVLDLTASPVFNMKIKF